MNVQQERLERLVETMEIVSGSTVFSPLPAGFNLPEKDLPILAAALLIQATHLLTGDKQHFGPYFGQVIFGVLIQRPTEYLREKVE